MHKRIPEGETVEPVVARDPRDLIENRGDIRDEGDGMRVPDQIEVVFWECGQIAHIALDVLR